MEPKRFVRLCVVVLLALANARPASAQGVQDFSVLRINEIIADNATRPPLDIEGGTPDIVEIFNGGEAQLTLGFDVTDDSLALSDTAFLPPESELWRFPPGLAVRAGESTIVFCDANIRQGDCEPHAAFRIASDGSEPITLWGPVVGEDDEGRPVREIIDQVWLPPLREDVSFGRVSDGAGPAPVPIDETFDHFIFYAPGLSTFGRCISLPVSCGEEGLSKRFCEGGENGGETENLEPRVSRLSQTTNSPAAGEPVSFVVDVRDDEVPIPPNIASVEIVYRVDEGEEQIVPLVYDENTGVLPDREGLEPGDVGFPAAPLDRRTLWTGAIPAQSEGARVRFFFRVTDSEGLSSTRPRHLCAFGVGPCARNFGGDGCELDPQSTACRNPDFDPMVDPPGEEFLFTGIRYRTCTDWFTYAVGYEPRPGLEGLVVNEVVAAQTMVLRDPTSNDPMICGGLDAPDYCCGDTADPTCGFDDFIEISNGSDRPIDMSGLWLSDSFFHPKGWRFPDGSILGPGAYAIVWMDDDGSKCPDAAVEPRPCFWECPDPNAPESGEYHATFELDASGDQIFIYDNEENDFGLIHGVDFEDLLPDTSLVLCPDGDREGRFRLALEPEPGEANDACRAVFFKRGDSTADCSIDITDAVWTLSWLFQGGPEPSCLDSADSDDSGSVDITDPVIVLNWLFLGGVPPAFPGPETPGPDESADELAECVYPDCSS